MNDERLLFARAIRGPIMLILLGALFALHQSGIIPIERTWPLLIIVVGLLILIERMAGPRVPPGQPPYGAPYTKPPAGGPAR